MMDTSEDGAKHKDVEIRSRITPSSMHTTDHVLGFVRKGSDIAGAF